MRARRFAGIRARLAPLLLTGAVLALPGRAPAAAAVKVLVAVLPVEVHSARSLEYVEDSLADLIRTRLEQSGLVRVLDAVVVREALVEHVAGERTDAALRRLARELGADWVVEGSLTELAGRFSLDVRVTPAGARVPARTMVLTATGEEELLARVNELAAEVLDVVAGREPRSVVAEVRVVGVDPLDPELGSRLRTRPGRPYESETLARDVETLQASPAIETAVAEIARGPQGVVVTFRLTPAPQPAAGPGPEPPPAEVAVSAPVPAVAPAAGGVRVAEVRIRGNRRIEADAIRARLATREGGIYSPAEIARDVREIHAMGFFGDVRVLTEETGDGRIVTFQVEENPLVRQITVSGNESIDSERIRDNLTLTTGSTLDHPLLFENRERIEALYRSEGYHLAEVSYEIERVSEDAVAVHFEVDENEKLRLRKIVFRGNEHFTEDELRKGFKTKPWRFYSHVTRFLDKSGSYKEPLFVQDLQSVERKYLDAGYLQVELDEPEVDTTEDGLVVTVEIREGKRFRVGKLDVTGDETVDLEALRAELSLEEGEWFNRSHLTRDVENLTHRYTDRGFYYAKVNPITNLSEQDLTVDVDFEVEKGPLYFVREIEISGNARTVDPVIRREMRLVEGQLWSARALDVSQGRIRNLGFFEEVNLEPQPTDYPDQLDLNVKVVERPTGSLSFGAGFSSQDGFVVSGSVAQSNLFGRGYGVQASADLGGDTDRFYLSFANSYLFGSDFSLSTTLFRTDLQFEDFPQQQQGAELTLGHALDEENRSRGFWRYSFADREVDEDTNVNAAGMIFRQILVGSQATSLTGLVLRTDTRDDRVLATEGYQLFAEADLAGLGGFAEFLRLEGRVGWYHRPPDWRWLPLPFRDRSALHLAARFGWALPFNSISDWDFKEGIASGVCLTADDETCALDQIDTDLELPLTERYFLGGIGTFQLRGFKARSVGPRRALVRRTGLAGTGDFFVPVGRAILEAPSGDLVTVCADVKDSIFNLQGNGNGKCNSLDDKDIDDFDDLDETDVIGGNKFVSLTAEYRFPISEALGLMGILFFDTGNAFAENEDMIDVANWRLGTGAGVLWFSPFGPIQAFLGFPLDPLEVEDTTVFEFSVGGVGL